MKQDNVQNRLRPRCTAWRGAISVAAAIAIGWWPGWTSFPVQAQADSDLANRCAVYLQRVEASGEEVGGDILMICRALRTAARDGGNAPDDCLYFTTVVEGVPLKQAMAACDALLRADPPTLVSAPQPTAGPAAASSLSAPALPPWLEEVLAQLISASFQVSGKQPNPDEIDRMRACLIRNQELGRNRALAACAREVYGG